MFDVVCRHFFPAPLNKQQRTAPPHATQTAKSKASEPGRQEHPHPLFTALWYEHPLGPISQQATRMQVHTVGAVRHAEKRRRGTCEFANRVARIALKKYESTVPQSYRDLHKQTCVAAIVACFQYENTDETSSDYEPLYKTKDHLQVIGFGVGTKFLSSSTIRDDPNNCTRIRDCHAEVLARRAFRRQLLHEIEVDVCGKTIYLPSDYIPILERVEEGGQPTQNKAKRFKSNSDDSCDIAAGEILKYRLKESVTLHFYASSAPCGNATLKKFVKMEKEIFDSSMVDTIPFHQYCLTFLSTHLSSISSF